MTSIANKTKNIEVTNAIGTKRAEIKASKEAKSKVTELILPSGQYSLSRFNGVDTLNDDGKKSAVCSYIAFKANLENDKTGKVSVLVEFVDHQSKRKKAIIPREDFISHSRLIDRLLSLGFCIHDQKMAKSFLSECYQSKPPKLNIRVVNEPGWHKNSSGGLNAFVINGKTFMPAGEICNIALDESVDAGYTSKGSDQGWIENVAPLCQGNARLSIMVCASLLGPLLELLGLHNVGLHIFGLSKSAKTTCLIVARSIYGDQYYGFSWNATTGALQKTANSRNDSVLFLDEISQCEAKHVSAAVYDLMNGTDKNRLGPDSKLNSVTHIRMVVISTGEDSLQEHLHQGGIKVKPGQLVRLPSIPVHPTKGMFPNLHGEATIGALSAKLRASVDDNYGTVGLTWIQHLVDNQVELKATLPAMVMEIAAKLLAAINVDEPSDAHRDVAKSMAATACAGEVAISCAVLPWSKGAAIKAAKACFKVWYQHENGEAIKREPFPETKKFFSVNQNSFVPLAQFTEDGDSSGYTHYTDGFDVFLVPLKKSENTLFKKFGEKAVLTELIKRDLLVLGSGNRPTKQFKIPKSELPRQSFYAIRRSILDTQ